MANQNNLTIYQRLNKVLNGSETEQTKFVVNRELIKDLDPQAYEREKLEAQQTLFLQGLWKKIDNELYQKAVFYEPTRIASYYDFEAMEFTPEIGAALDLYMEESCTANESGSILQIYSESDRIKKILEELFFDVLDISSNLPPWTRNIPEGATEKGRCGLQATSEHRTYKGRTRLPESNQPERPEQGAQRKVLLEKQRFGIQLIRNGSLPPVGG